MPRSRSKKPKAKRAATNHLAVADAIGLELTQSITRVLEAPGQRLVGASALASRIDFSRVLICRILNALKCDEPLEAMQRLPGPESLRTFVDEMRRLGVASTRVKAALTAIERFDDLIRKRFRTRAALNAAISSHAPSMLKRLELGARQRVFAGMRELRGGEADAWLSTTMVVPSRDDPSKLTSLVLQGFIGLRQLRSDLSVYFDFVPVNESGAAKQTVDDLPVGPAGLSEFCTNPPAKLEIEEVAGRKIYRLASTQIGKDVVCDMLSFMRIPGSLPRFAKSAGRRTGPFALIKAPVKTLHFDVLIADGLVDDSVPELFVFSPGPRNCTNVNDRIDDLDRVTVPERVEVMRAEASTFEVAAVPNYRRLVERMASDAGHDLTAMRVHRVSIAYPPFGYEFVSTFRLRSAP